MSSFCSAKATHIFFSKTFQHICVSLIVNFNESLTSDVVSFEQLGPVQRRKPNLTFFNSCCIFDSMKASLQTIDFSLHSHLPMTNVFCYALTFSNLKSLGNMTQIFLLIPLVHIYEPLMADKTNKQIIISFINRTGMRRRCRAFANPHARYLCC